MLTRRLLLVVFPAAFLVAFVVTVGIFVPAVLGAQLRPDPLRNQPLAFDHSIHVKVAGLECQFCHRTAAKGMTAGYPDVQQCMFCHSVIGAPQVTHPDIEKVRTAWAQQKPIEWERIHRMPDHVHFVHEAHITAGFGCAECHGEVKDMSQVRQVRNLGMGDCLDCHRKNNAPTDCVACHY